MATINIAPLDTEWGRIAISTVLTNRSAILSAYCECECVSTNRLGKFCLLFNRELKRHAINVCIVRIVIEMNRWSLQEVKIQMDEEVGWMSSWKYLSRLQCLYSQESSLSCPCPHRWPRPLPPSPWSAQARSYIAGSPELAVRERGKTRLSVRIHTMRQHCFSHVLCLPWWNGWITQMNAFLLSFNNNW